MHPCPATKMKSPSTTACEYGPIGLGAFSVRMVLLKGSSSIVSTGNERGTPPGRGSSELSSATASAPQILIRPKAVQSPMMTSGFGTRAAMVVGCAEDPAAEGDADGQPGSAGERDDA